ncbi:MAG: thiamine pyrophosphate-binding protein [Pseudomonadota bacterium]|nr:thiamine pyrophosphate-binding protein [Pseudomonadota bacterium]
MAAATVAEYLLQQLQESGVDHVFGVPGDYVLGFYSILAGSPLQHIGTTREDTSAFAADGYARCRGIGALAVTYGVGALNVVNAIAGAYAESSPVVVISGAPGISEQRKDPMIHHRFGPFSFQREIFERITCATAVLDDPLTAFRDIDRCLRAARQYSKPVYLELPRDQLDAEGYPIPASVSIQHESDAGALSEAVGETIELLKKAGRPVILAGVEIHRRGLQDILSRLVLNACIPVAATLTGKSVVGERHAAYLGVYEGAMGPDFTRERVEAADLLLMLGATVNDVDTGIFTAKLDPERMIHASQDQVTIGHHRYSEVYLHDFLSALCDSIRPHSCSWPQRSPVQELPPAVPGKPMTIARLIASLNAVLTPEMSVICDVGDCLFAALELRVHERTHFLASAFYTSMGFAVPAALGAQIGSPDLRPLILVGDGAFQMTGTELSTFSRLGLDPVVILFNNHGYSTERFILEGSFNDIAEWRYENIGKLIGAVNGFHAETEDEFDHTLRKALNTVGRPSLVNVNLKANDASPAMRRLAQHLSQRVKG